MKRHSTNEHVSDKNVLVSSFTPQPILSAKNQIPKQGELIYRRERLHDQVSVFLQSGNLWVSGPPGAGKTVLVSNYAARAPTDVAWYEIDLLDNDPVTFFSCFPWAFESFSTTSARSEQSLPRLLPEDMLALPVFARKFFRVFFSLLPKKWLLIFDNIQELSPDSPIPELIALCLQELPVNCRVILISRILPPPDFAKMKTSGLLHVLDAESLRFNRQEIREVMALHGIGESDETDCIDYLKQTTAGWAAGLTLLLKEQNKEICSQAGSDDLDNQELFDYFTGVIFSKFSGHEKRLLIQAALLPDIRPDILDQLHGEFSSREYLMELSRNNFFTYTLGKNDDLFQFHPLFKEFLRNEAGNVLPARELSNFQEQAAKILSDEGRTTDAVELLNHAQRWELSAALIKKSGSAMVMQGRFKTLLRWQNILPEDIVNNDPWLLFLFGNAVTAFNPVEAIDLLKRSFNLFQELNNTTGALLACSSLTNSIINHLSDLSTLDPWLDFLEQQLDPHTFPNDGCFENNTISNAIFRGLVLRRPAHPDLEAWLQLIIDQGGMHPAIITHYLWTGRFTEARAALDRIYTQTDQIGSKLQLSAIKAMEAQYYLIMNDPDNCCRVIDESLQMINETGIRVWEVHFLVIGMGVCINSANQQKTEQYLQAVENNIGQARMLERSYYHVAKTLAALLSGDLIAADRHQQSALEMAVSIGMPSYETWGWYCSAVVAIFQKNHKAALLRFERVFELAASPGNPWFTCQAHLGIAYMYLQKGERKTAVKNLQQGLLLARCNNYLSFLFFLPKMLGSLAVLALEEDIEPEFVCRFITKKQLIPEHPPVHLAHWPWPLKIFTMGRFAVICNGKQLRSSSFAQKKPIMLLQALIALGGRQVSKTRLNDIFWPLSEGDAQAAALKITLHRLRRMLGIKNIIYQTAGHLSLNPHLCWVDSWRFERLANEAFLHDSHDVTNKQTEKQRALTAYQGEFLSAYHDTPWILDYRQRLKNIHRQLLLI